MSFSSHLIAVLIVIIIWLYILCPKFLKNLCGEKHRAAVMKIGRCKSRCPITCHKVSINIFRYYRSIPSVVFAWMLTWTTVCKGDISNFAPITYPLIFTEKCDVFLKAFSQNLFFRHSVSLYEHNQLGWNLRSTPSVSNCKSNCI